MHSKHFSMLGVQAERVGLWGSAARIIAGLRSTGDPLQSPSLAGLWAAVTVWCVPSSPIAVICCAIHPQGMRLAGLLKAGRF